jgi:type 1 glutamine amidotransferase
MTMPASFHMPAKIKVAVLTGQHTFDVPSFHTLFRSMSSIDPYVQTLEDFAADVGRVHSQYDALVFYNFHREVPDPDSSRAATAVYQTLHQLGESAQGIVVLHHAILAFPEWPLWSELCGIQDRHFGYHDNQRVRLEIANAQHPITRGLTSWEMVDETYTMHDAGEGSDILLTTDHPKSMKTIAWARQFKRARVFCFESGHDNQAYADAHFSAVLERGIQWVANKL